MRKTLTVCLALALMLPVMSGCASKYGEQKTTVNYYPGCYAPIKDLRDRENTADHYTAGGAVMGALGGALIGLLATGKWEGAVVGAAAGGASGAVAGNIYGKRTKEQEDTARLASYMQNLDGDISNLDIAGAAARTSLQCYDSRFNALVTDIKNRKINRQVAASRFAEISSGREEALAILGEVVTNANNLVDKYNNAFIREEQIMQSPQSAPTSPVVYQKKRQAINKGRSQVKKLEKTRDNWIEVRNEGNAETIKQQRELAELSEILKNAEI